jgi:hypothetical protein
VIRRRFLISCLLLQITSAWGDCPLLAEGDAFHRERFGRAIEELHHFVGRNYGATETKLQVVDCGVVPGTIATQYRLRIRFEPYEERAGFAHYREFRCTDGEAEPITCQPSSHRQFRLDGRLVDADDSSTPAELRSAAACVSALQSQGHLIGSSWDYHSEREIVANIPATVPIEAVRCDRELGTCSVDLGQYSFQVIQRPQEQCQVSQLSVITP